MNEHTVNIRVTYKDTDQMGVVYYSNYLVWFEIARTEFFREHGMEYKRLETEDRIFLPVTEAFCRYRAPIRYDDVVQVTVKLSEMKAKRITFEYEIKKKGKTTSTGHTKHAFINIEGKVVPIPEKIRSEFLK
ncbi:MAG: thioesterase family protein [Candidatus Omnitrophota bacterium]